MKVSCRISLMSGFQPYGMYVLPVRNDPFYLSPVRIMSIHKNKVAYIKKLGCLVAVSLPLLLTPILMTTASRPWCERNGKTERKDGTDNSFDTTVEGSVIHIV